MNTLRALAASLAALAVLASAQVAQQITCSNAAQGAIVVTSFAAAPNQLFVWYETNHARVTSNAPPIRSVYVRVGRPLVSPR